jgi:outer membrane biosynthesis protein TonB
MNRQSLLAILSVAILSCSPQTPRAPQRMATQRDIISTRTTHPPDNIAPVQNAEPSRVGADVKAPVVIRRIDPNFSACRGRYSGIPMAEAIITSEGNVRGLRLLNSVSPCVDQAVLASLKQWKFTPGTLNGRPVEAVFNLTVNIDYR